MASTTGSCLCGAIQISTKSESTASVVCGCTHCQHCSGSAFSVNLVYPKDSIEIVSGKDQLRVYEDTGDSGNTMLRHFCGVCGCAIWSQVQDGTCFVKAPVIPGALEKTPGGLLYEHRLPGWAGSIKTGGSS